MISKSNYFVIMAVVATFTIVQGKLKMLHFENHYIILKLLLFSGISLIPCPTNEMFLLCGPSCPMTCNNIANPPTCNVNSCIRGCFCKPGYYRNGNRNCVVQRLC